MSNVNASGPVANNGQVAEFWSREQKDLFEKWHSSYADYEDNYQSPYFDYYYTGQDISCEIEGLSGELLPIYNFGYVIQQQKQPVYGFWDYTFSAMMRGTRIVSGAFSLVSTQPHYLTRQIARASQVRSKVNSDKDTVNDLYALRGLDSDESNVDRYWRRNYDNNLDTAQQHLFSVHPPFNLILTYGIQETSLISNNPAARMEEFMNKYEDTPPLASDQNERLVKNPSKPEETQVLLENIELTSKSVEFNTDGDPILETYTFMARDERILSPQVYQSPSILASPPRRRSTPPVNAI